MAIRVHSITWTYFHRSHASVFHWLWLDGGQEAAPLASSFRARRRDVRMPQGEETLISQLHLITPSMRHLIPTMDLISLRGEPWTLSLAARCKVRVWKQTVPRTMVDQPMSLYGSWATQLPLMGWSYEKRHLVQSQRDKAGSALANILLKKCAIFHGVVQITS